MSSYVPQKGKIDLSDIYKEGTDKYLTIALSVQASEFSDRFYWAFENDFAMEYTPDPLKPELIAEHVNPFLKEGVPVRFHTRFFDYEMGNEDVVKAAEALNIHKNVVKAITNLGKKNVTIHLNLNKRIPFNIDNAVGNLSKLTAYAREKGVTVCLENLKAGPSSDPANVTAWADKANSLITMDMGHAVSSQHVADGKATVPEIVDIYAYKLHEIHMYAKEEDRHYPITDITDYKEPINRILRTRCRWWTIELDSIKEALSTREILLKYLTQLREEKK